VRCGRMGPAWAATLVIWDMRGGGIYMMGLLKTRGLATFIQNPRGAQVDRSIWRSRKGKEGTRRSILKQEEGGDMELGIIENEKLLRFAWED